MGKPRCIGFGCYVADNNEGTFGKGFTYRTSVWHRNRRVCVNDPKRLYPPVPYRVKHVNGLQTWSNGQLRDLPKITNRGIVIGVLNITGLGFATTQALVNLASGNLYLMLGMAAVVSISSSVNSAKIGCLAAVAEMSWTADAMPIY